MTNCGHNKTVLVTGHNGFIGSPLCELLISSGWLVIGLGRGSACNTSNDVMCYELDLFDKLEVYNVIVKHNPSVIIHLAGGPTKTAGIDNFRDCFDLNQQGSWNVIDAALKVSNLKRFIFLGSCEEYGSIDVPFEEFARELPNTAYGLAKLSITHLLQALSRTHNFPGIILRPSVIYGPGQKKAMFLPSLIEHLLNDRVFDMTNGDQTRDFVYIDDLLAAIIKAMQAPISGGEIINISSCFPILIKDLAREVAKQINNEAASLINFGAIDCKLGEAVNYYANNSKSKILLGWIPQIALKEGIRRTIDWQRFEITKQECMRKNET